mmetsp:Transcript_101837/g.318243  ORF Transcript_101837/g.318243 Transcript_101837/m.318243 type:complete len:356 (-) Transcript_101837:804-1871(-)
MSLTICAAEESLASAVVLTTRQLLPMLVVPAETLEPGSFLTGVDSPVRWLSSKLDEPSKTAPSTGTRSPARTTMWSPTATRSAGTRSPLDASTASSGRSSSTEASAERARALARLSSHSDRPNRNITAAASANSSMASAPDVANIMRQLMSSLPLRRAPTARRPMRGRPRTTAVTAKRRFGLCQGTLTSLQREKTHRTPQSRRSGGGHRTPCAPPRVRRRASSPAALRASTRSPGTASWALCFTVVVFAVTFVDTCSTPGSSIRMLSMMGTSLGQQMPSTTMTVVQVSAAPRPRSFARPFSSPAYTSALGKASAWRGGGGRSTGLRLPSPTKLLHSPLESSLGAERRAKSASSPK